MRRVALISCVAFGFAGGSAHAQAPGKDDIIQQLTPAKPLTRSLARTRKIEVVSGKQEEVLKEVAALPSINIRVLFAIDSDRLTPEGEAALRPLGEALKDPKLSSFRMLIAGHTDAAGSAEHNQNLSERRAQSVRAYLVGTHLIAPSRLEAMGFGFKKLANPTNPLDQANRRVEVVNLTQ